MKNKNLVLMLLMAVPFASGCGKDVSGTYKGNESVQQSSAVTSGALNGGYAGGVAGAYGTTYTNTTQAPMSTQASGLTITISQTNGNSVSGTYQSLNFGSGTVSGTKNSNNSSEIDVTLSLPQAAALVPNPAAYNGALTGGVVGGSVGSTVNGQPSMTQCPGTYTGALTLLDDKHMTGVLTSNSTNPYCSGSRSIDVTK